MAASTEQEITLLASEVTRRWQDVDPLLPAARPPGPGCGAEFVSTDEAGLVARGTCEHWSGAPDSLDISWGAATQFTLTVHVAGPEMAGRLDSVLAAWGEHLRAMPEAARDDTAAVVLWPSRDIDGTVPLLRHGFVPMAVIAARAGRQSAPADQHAAALPPGVSIRRAGSGDLAAVVGLGLEVVRFDAHFGGVTERPSTAGALASQVAELLDDEQPWVWLAERDGAAVGMLAAERPAQAAWIAPRSGPGPVAYLLLMGVRAGARGRGVGAALAARLAAETAGHEVLVTLLHYAQVNPLSAPFWSQQGYRPLWTCWEARPPGAVR